MISNMYPQPNLSFLNFIKCAKIDKTVPLPRSVVLIFFLTFNGTIFKLCSTKNHMWLYFCHVWWFNYSFLANDGSIITLGSTNITFDRTVLTFSGTFVTFNDSHFFFLTNYHNTDETLKMTKIPLEPKKWQNNPKTKINKIIIIITTYQKKNPKYD